MASTVSPELLEILVCPETKQPVRPAGPDVLDPLNERIRRGEVRNRGGDPVGEPLAEALVREDGKLLYPVDEGIPVMLLEEAIEL